MMYFLKKSRPTLQRRLLAVPLAGLLAAGCSVFGIRTTEEPSFTVLEQEADFELRSYSAYAVARTKAEGDYQASSNAAFRRLADYIFGENVAGSELAMTAPVLQSEGGTKIAMTAPVLQERTSDAWTMEFVLPEGVTAATAPRPLDPAIQLEDVPARKVAVLEFSGRLNENNIRENSERLLAWVQERGLETDSAPRSAGYDPPWTLPMLRRNEIQIDVR